MKLFHIFVFVQKEKILFLKFFRSFLAISLKLAVLFFFTKLKIKFIFHQKTTYKLFFPEFSKLTDFLEAEIIAPPRLDASLVIVPILSKLEFRVSEDMTESGLDMTDSDLEDIVSDS